MTNRLNRTRAQVPATPRSRIVRSNPSVGPSDRVRQPRIRSRAVPQGDAHSEAPEQEGADTSVSVETYRVGRGRPPLHTRFQPGQSGNPSGRPRRQTRSWPDLLAEELSEPITFSENGQRRTITKQRALIKRMVNQALEGRTRAQEIVAKMFSSGNADRSSEDALVESLSPEERTFLIDLIGELDDDGSAQPI